MSAVIPADATIFDKLVDIEKNGKIGKTIIKPYRAPKEDADLLLKMLRLLY